MCSASEEIRLRAAICQANCIFVLMHEELWIELVYIYAYMHTFSLDVIVNIIFAFEFNIQH